MTMPVPTKESNTLWYLFPILLSWLGGLVGYLYWRNHNKLFARKLFVIGIVLTVVYLILLVAIGSSYNNTEDKINVKQTEKIDMDNSVIKTQITDLEIENSKLQNENSRLKLQNDQLEFELDNIQEKTCDEHYDEVLLNILALSAITAPINIEGNTRQYDLTHYDGLGIVGISATQELKILQDNILKKIGNADMEELEKCNITDSEWDVYGYFYQGLVQQLQTMKEELE